MMAQIAASSRKTEPGPGFVGQSMAPPTEKTRAIELSDPLWCYDCADYARQLAPNFGIIG